MTKQKMIFSSGTHVCMEMALQGKQDKCGSAKSNLYKIKVKKMARQIR